jgi:hypothetical protein
MGFANGGFNLPPTPEDRTRLRARLSAEGYAGNVVAVRDYDYVLPAVDDDHAGEDV